jgi:hypothetical protein
MTFIHVTLFQLYRGDSDQTLCSYLSMIQYDGSSSPIVREDKADHL